MNKDVEIDKKSIELTPMEEVEKTAPPPVGGNQAVTTVKEAFDLEMKMDDELQENEKPPVKYFLCCIKLLPGIA